ncbi:MAG: hypothetical protein R3D05_00625 [Dongiaceae bacterium]
MWVARIKITLFALVLASPVAALLLLGVADSYGRPQSRFPAVAKVLLGKKGRFDQFGDAVLERSIVRRLAIQLRNWAGYRVLGFVDNEYVVSGSGSWLFYRAEFLHGRCLDEAETAIRLRRLATLIDIGRATGIDMVTSVSPDKSTVYPEALSTFARSYWKCRLSSIDAFRRLIRREVPALIDHAEALLAEKARNPGVPLYYTTDTHWTPYGGAIALRQLLAALYPDTRVPPPSLTAPLAPRRTDLSRLLLLQIEERASGVEPLREEDLGPEIADRPASPTLIVGDSFYAIIASQLRDLFPRNTSIRLIREVTELDSDLMTADRLIINLVERSLLPGLNGGVLDWRAPIPAAIVARNMRRIHMCAAFRPAESEVLNSSTDGQSHTIALRAIAPDRLPCLRMSVTARRPAVLQISLPNSATGAFEPGHDLKVQLEPGSQVVGFVLPSYVGGSHVQLQPDSDGEAISISTIEVGEAPAPLFASATLRKSLQP